MKDKHVGMLMGGGNAEHEVSLKTGAALAQALRSRGYRVTDVLAGEDLPQALLREKIEVAWARFRKVCGMPTRGQDPHTFGE